MEIDEPLIFAIVENDQRGVKQALDQGSSADMKLPNGNNPIHEAILYENRYECIQILLSHPTANINAVTPYGDTALLYACKYNQVNTVELLVNHPDCDINLPDINQRSPLHVACVKGSLAIIQILVIHGCLVDPTDIGGSTPLHAILSPAPMYAVIGTDRMSHIVSYLLANRADPSKKNFYGRTPFHYACENGFLKCAKLMHSFASSKDLLINQCSNIGESPLMIAVTSKKILIIKYLLSQGADANIKDNKGWTALHYACKGDDVELLLLLLQHCTVIQPEDLLEWLDNKLYHVSEKIFETLLSLSPYYRPSRNLLSLHLPFHDYFNVQLNSVHSLASHCRSVIRRSFNYDACSTLSVFREELFNLNLPKTLECYLCYRN